MLIVDAQVHIWGADTPERPWPASGKGRAHRPLPFSKEDLLREMGAAGVARAVIVPPSWEGDRNDLALAAAQSHPERFAVMGRPPLDRADPTALDHWRDQTGMLGIRVTTAGVGARELFTEPSGDWLWAAAERNSLPVMVSTPGLLPEVGRIAERHPGLRLVIDHLALSREGKDEAAFAELPHLLALAKHPNVAAKASALPRYSTEPYPYPRLLPLLRHVFDAFGPQRMFWGTDLTGIPCTYPQAVALFAEHLPWLKGADLDWVMGRALCEWLRWPLPT
ncbi:MAG TPA: amidohydrolase family protein [Stellaceae bacterium]|jgi:predicted TIM-barrel fold metal-dependent hydrolase|nr:amidohydrolase family protein [Stellaceae bacterium]